MRRCFSTLGCSDLTFPEICALAAEFHTPGLELRGIGGRMDMPEYCAAAGLTPQKIGDLCRQHATRVVVAGSSIKLTSTTEDERPDFMNFCAWADGLGAPYVRIFGGGTWGKPITDAEYAHAADFVRWWRKEQKARHWTVELLLETHDAFSASEPCLHLNRRLAQPLYLIWDTHHTWRMGAETPEQTWRQIGSLVKHVQIKDSVDKPSARHPYTYVLPGDGQMPLAEVVELLQRVGFDGFTSLEWERHWHPYLPPIREALARLEKRNWFLPATHSQTTVGATASGVALAELIPRSPSEPAYDWWRKAAETLLEPLARLMQPDQADLPLQGQASNHGAQADRLESFARPCLLAAHWLASEPAPNEKLSRDQVAQWFLKGFLVGTAPASKQYWGPTANHHQHTVEMAALTLAFQAARKALWEPLSKRERAQVAQWFATIRGAGLHRNNHMFFNVMTLAFLQQEGYGRRADPPVMRHLLDLIESMALGGGWFIDGMNETVDYYQAYAFHYYGPWWAKLYGHSDPARARRWKNWSRQFLKDYVCLFAATGENPPFGRSMCYRFAATAPFALAEHCGVSAIPPGQARRLCSLNLEFFLKHPITQSQGALSLGWTDEFPALTEAYSCAGSVYWAAKGFAPLLLPRKHPFWQQPEKALPAEGKDFQRAIPQAGLVVRSHDGAVEVLNNANGITLSNVKFGTWKWGKLSFRSGLGGEVAPAENIYPADASLTAEFADATIAGRHQCQPVAVSRDHCASVYGLGDRFSQNHITVETHLWWKAGWQLHWHRVTAHQKTRLRLGTYSLPLPDSRPQFARAEAGYGLAYDSHHGIAIQPLFGFLQVTVRESDPRQRTHILTWHSLLLLGETDWLFGDHDLLALTWTGRRADEAQKWTVKLSQKGDLLLQHPTLGPWEINWPELPKI
jgi:sugar phosphate isomerase/epimerase